MIFVKKDVLEAFLEIVAGFEIGFEEFDSLENHIVVVEEIGVLDMFCVEPHDVSETEEFFVSNSVVKNIAIVGIFPEIFIAPFAKRGSDRGSFFGRSGIVVECGENSGKTTIVDVGERFNLFDLF